jgi:signal transduction histidine kinase
VRSVPRWPYLLVCGLGLVIYLWAAAAQMRVSALPSDLQTETLSYPVTLQGWTVGSPDELDFLVQGIPAGSLVQITDAQGGLTESMLVRHFSFMHRVFTYMSGLILWLVGASFFATRTDRPETRYFFWATFAYGLAIMVGGVFHPASVGGPQIALPVLRICSLALVVTFFVHLSLQFPRTHRVLREWRFLVPGLYLLPTLIALWYSVTVLRYLGEPTTTHWSEIALPSILSQVLFVGYFLTGVCLFYQSGRRAERSRERQQVKWIFWGIGIGAAPFVFLWTLPRLFGLSPSVPLETTRFFAIACPLAFAIAIVRHQFLDIDVIIRRSLIYPVLAAALVFVYFLIGVWLAGLVRTRFPSASHALSLAAVAVSVILFGPTRRLIGWAVDRWLFKIRNTHERALVALRERLRENLYHQDVVNAVRTTARDVLLPKRSAVLCRYREGFYWSGDPEGRISSRALADFAEWFREDERPVAVVGSTAVAEVESERFPKRYQELGYQVAVPVTVSEECQGLVMLGHRETERRYLEQDLGFLADLVEQARLALERIGLMRQLAEEATARSQLDELNRLKSEFLSRVAHDFRTPLTSIRWSTQNLKDGVAGETNARQKEYLDAIDASASHLSRLVNDLLEVGRLEAGATEVRPERVDLADVVESSLVSLRPIAAAKGVEFEVRSSPLPPVALANADMMLAVMNNLVENAIRFTPERSAVEIDLSREDRWQRIAIRDYGPGIPEEDREVIFERFHQSLQSGAYSGQGFGIGLYVVKSFLDAMEGRVWAENHPEVGARFVCLVPAWSGDAEDHDEGERTDR